MIDDQLKANLQSFIHDRIGADRELAGLHESDGHAGLTFLFETRRQGTHEIDGRFVLKIPPKGVARRGNTDVYRQAPLLRALHGAGLPVPDVPWADENEHWFGVPFIVMERLPGRVFFVWDPHASFARDQPACEALWRQCVDELPRIHRFDWRTRLAGWEQPQSLEDMIRYWRKIYLHSPEPGWITQAEEVEALLLKTMPTADPIGVFHGDFQPGNCLYEHGRLTGIIDWELAGIGAQLLDIGWLMMAADRHNWVDEWCSIHPPPTAEIRERYEAGMGRAFPDIPWFQAFAGFRLASIGCLNVKLHRRGQRHDPIWEMMGLTLSNMFERSRQLLLDPAA